MPSLAATRRLRSSDTRRCRPRPDRTRSSDRRGRFARRVRVTRRSVTPAWRLAGGSRPVLSHFLDKPRARTAAARVPARWVAAARNGTVSLPIRPGMTVPLPGPLHSHRDKLVELADLGYTDIWSAEADGADAFTPLALAAAWEPRLRLGTAIVPAFTRSPACFAQCVATLADAAPGRFAIGIGSSSNVIVERWNGVPFAEPYKKVRDVVRFLRDALGGEKVAKAYDTFEVQGFRLNIRPEQPPPILIAALRAGMLGLAGREADGVIINWLAPEDVAKVVGVVSAAAGGAEREVVARIFVCPSENTAAVRAGARMAIAAYLNVPVYAEFHRWLGRGDQLQPMWDAWAAGDRKGALAAIPDEVVDALVVHGPAAKCRRRIQQYFDEGVTTSSLAIMPLDPELSHREAVRQLAPTAS
ncbi:MAG: LLM class F420-dependent oxidoreductase [Acidimicrobiia bacterium]|nr:LLM class F420-dependent oxidoreductase [Acidimicrobiia bacterium]